MLVTIGEVVFFGVPVVGREDSCKRGCQQGNLVGDEIANKGPERLACLGARGHGAATAGQELEEGHGEHVQQIRCVSDGYATSRHNDLFFLFGVRSFCFKSLLIIGWCDKFSRKEFEL